MDAAVRRLSAILIAAATVAAWQTVPPRRSAADAQAAAGAAETSAYVRWLDEDVVYIIDNRERAAFQALTTDAERHMFIEQFRQRRDPTPGAQENAFKKEHYRRIAYTNQHFAMPWYRRLADRPRSHVYRLWPAG